MLEFKYYVFTLDGLWIFTELGYNSISAAIEAIQDANLLDRKSKNYSYKKSTGRFIYKPRDNDYYTIVRYDCLTALEKYSVIMNM